MVAQEATFGQSVGAGIGGFFKGGFAGSIVGAAAGLVIGLVAAIAAGPLAILGGIVTGAIGFGALGSFAGTMTGVVRSREAGRVSGQDVANVANIAFAQGVQVGHQMTMQSAQEAHETSTHFRKLVEEQRSAAEREKQR